MGLFRLTLAFCVVLYHGLNLDIPAATGDVAVQAFYLVSGFYMGMVLTEKYRGFSIFFTNRLLRLYPAYLIVLLLTIGYSIALLMSGRSGGDPGLALYQTHFGSLGIGAKVYLIGTNLLLWGQDIALFLKLSNDGHSLAFTSNFIGTSPHVEKFLLVPQSWSLSIELGFYLLAPWLVARRSWILCGIVALTLAVRIGLAMIGLSFDPWTYRFFPVEIGTFVLGVLTYRSMPYRTTSKSVQQVALAGLFALTVTLSAIPGEWVARVAYFGYCVWALPLVFELTRRNRFDRYLGELSYPVYLVHLLILSIAADTSVTGSSRALLSVASIVALSIALNELVQKPIDRLRARRVA